MHTALPVQQIAGQFRSLLSDYDLVVAASTGSGKSTYLPLWAAEQGTVLVVQPRRVACLALAEYVASLSGSALGEKVGYAVRQQQCYDGKTEVVFVTPGIALRWWAENRLAGFRSVMLDEFHERRWDTDLLLAMLKKHGKHRLIVASATLAAAPLARYLEAQVLEAEGRNFPVRVAYLASEPHLMPTHQDLEKRVKPAVLQALAETPGDVLVFLAGRGEINRCIHVLQSLENKGQAIQVLQLHGGINIQTQHEVLSAGQRRRVILATNVAETSLTLPGITAVVDSGLERRTIQRNGRTVLALMPISKASAMQRQGRAGRVQAGLCLRLWGEHAPLEVQTPGQIRREALSEMVLAAACADMPVGSLEFFEAPPEKALHQACRRLRSIRAIDNTGIATAYGQQIFPLPVDSFFAHLISSMPDGSSREALVDLSAVLSRGIRISLPSDEQGRKALQQWCPDPCDLMTRIQLLRGPVPGVLKVDSVQLKEAREMAQQLRQQLELPALNKTTKPQPERIARALLQAWPQLAFVRRLKRPDAMGNGEMEVIIGEQSRLAEDTIAALVLDDHSVPGKRGTRQTLTVATCLMPVNATWLVDSGLCEVADSEPYWEDQLLYVNREHHYAGRVLFKQQVEPRGEALCDALAQLILQGRLFRGKLESQSDNRHVGCSVDCNHNADCSHNGVGSQLEEDLQAWALFQSLGLSETVASPVPSARQWLRQRLLQLGVESTDDLELIDAQDLRFEGVPDWQRASFDEKYPRRVKLSDLVLAVHYAPAARLVTLEWLTGSRKKDPARWELPGWQGWKIRYRKASRVIDIR
ncbi:MAG: helicase-related protein [Marinobacterium sp.]|nr:helicase-related protein [Marinobacterium sp.]